MVNARQPVKPTKVKPSSASASASTAKKWHKVTSKKPKKCSDESLPACIECGEVIDTDVKALQCECVLKKYGNVHNV